MGDLVDSVVAVAGGRVQQFSFGGQHSAAVHIDGQFSISALFGLDVFVTPIIIYNKNAEIPHIRCVDRLQCLCVLFYMEIFCLLIR